MPKLIYLSGPIAGLEYEGAVDWRSNVTMGLRQGLSAISPMRGKEMLQGRGPINPELLETMRAENGGDILNIDARSITCRDFFDVERCDAMLMNMTQANPTSPSVGSSIELGWAWALRKPTVLVCPKTDEMGWYWKHPIVVGSIGWQVETLDEGIAVINGLFGEV